MYVQKMQTHAGENEIKRRIERVDPLKEIRHQPRY